MSSGILDGFDQNLIIRQPQPPQTYYFLYSNLWGAGHPFPLIFAVGSSLLYLACVYVFWPLTRGIAQANQGLFKAWRKAHNIFLFFYSAICCGSTFWFMLQNGEFAVFGPKGFTPMLCNDIPNWLWWMNVTFVFSKVYEMLDTAFIVWMKVDSSKGKDLSFLHVYHHATTFWLFLNVSNMNSTVKQGMLFNGFVHTLMYAHYAWPFPKRFVPLITLSQICQLIFVTWVWGATPAACPALRDFPEKYPFEFWTNYAFAPVYLIFFLHFFAQKFVFGGSKKKRSGAAEVDSPTGSPVSPTGSLVRRSAAKKVD